MNGFLTQLFLCLFLVFLSISLASRRDASDVCARAMPDPQQPFRVIWNHPDNCESKNIPLHLSDYGIIFNKQRTFLGEEIQTLYHTGGWPTLDENGKHINGGLPQLMDSTSFPQTRKDLSQNYVSNFDGLAVMDFETWRAAFVTNFGTLSPYMDEMRKVVHHQHPYYNTTMVEKVAEEEWDAAARKIFASKLAIGQELMPRGHWGYYLYPRSWGDTNTVQINDKLRWLWHHVTGLYPSVYLKHPDDDTKARMERVRREVREAVRIQATFSPPNTPIYTYSNFNQGTNVLFSKEQLKAPIGLPADMGASGAVLWGSSDLYKDENMCQKIQHYVHDVLGPYVKHLTQFTSDCSKHVCGGHGRCVHNEKDTLVNATESLSLSTKCTSRNSDFHHYHCRCYSNWSGPCCHSRNPSPCQHVLEPAVIG